MCYRYMKENLANLQDDELVCLFQQRKNAEAFEELVFRYKNSLYQYILAMVKEEAVAEDLFQEVFIGFFKHAEKYTPQQKFKSWLFLVARNKVFNYIRDTHKNMSLDETDEEGNFIWHDTLADKTSNMWESLSQQELSLQLERAVGCLSPHQREIIYLRPYFSFKEISQLVGRPLGTVLADCYRGVQKMQQLLNDNEDEL